MIRAVICDYSKLQYMFMYQVSMIEQSSLLTIVCNVLLTHVGLAQGCLSRADRRHSEPEVVTQEDLIPI